MTLKKTGIFVVIILACWLLTAGQAHGQQTSLQRASSPIMTKTLLEEFLSDIEDDSLRAVIQHLYRDYREENERRWREHVDAAAPVLGEMEERIAKARAAPPPEPRDIDRPPPRDPRMEEIRRELQRAAIHWYQERRELFREFVTDVSLVMEEDDQHLRRWHDVAGRARYHAMTRQINPGLDSPHAQSSHELYSDPFERLRGFSLPDDAARRVERLRERYVVDRDAILDRLEREYEETRLAIIGIPWFVEHDELSEVQRERRQRMSELGSLLPDLHREYYDALVEILPPGVAEGFRQIRYRRVLPRLYMETPIDRAMQRLEALSLDLAAEVEVILFYDRYRQQRDLLRWRAIEACYEWNAQDVREERLRRLSELSEEAEELGISAIALREQEIFSRNPVDPAMRELYDLEIESCRRLLELLNNSIDEPLPAGLRFLLTWSDLINDVIAPGALVN